MTSSNITVDTTSDLFSLSVVNCANFSCVYRNTENDTCILKRISINTNGECENYRTANMIV